MLGPGCDDAQQIPMSAATCGVWERGWNASPHTSAVGCLLLLHATPRSALLSILASAVNDHAAAVAIERTEWEAFCSAVRMFCFSAAVRRELLQFLFSHFLISGPLRSNRSLLPPQPAEWIVVMLFSASSTKDLPNSSLNASRMMRLLMPRKR